MITDDQIDTVYNVLTGSIDYTALFKPTAKGTLAYLREQFISSASLKKKGTAKVLFEKAFDPNGKLRNADSAHNLIEYYTQGWNSKKNSDYLFRAMIICALIIRQGDRASIRTLKTLTEKSKEFKNPSHLEKLKVQLRFLLDTVEKSSNTNFELTSSKTLEEKAQQAISKIDNYQRILLLGTKFRAEKYFTEKSKLACDILGIPFDLFNKNSIDINHYYKKQALLTHSDKTLPDDAAFILCEEAKEFLKNFMKASDIVDTLNRFDINYFHKKIEEIKAIPILEQARKKPLALNLMETIAVLDQQDAKIGELQLDLNKILEDIESVKPHYTILPYQFINIGSQLTELALDTMRSEFQKERNQLEKKRSNLTPRVDDYNYYLIEKFQPLEEDLRQIRESEGSPEIKALRMSNTYNFGLLLQYFESIRRLLRKYETESRRSSSFFNFFNPVSDERYESLQQVRKTISDAIEATQQRGKDSLEQDKHINQDFKNLNSVLAQEIEKTRKSHNPFGLKFWDSRLSKQLSIARQLTPPTLESFDETRTYKM